MTHSSWWIKENQPLAIFLIAQALTLIVSLGYGLTYMVRLENRMQIIETRGSPHLAEINNRLTVLEKQTESNLARIDRVTEIMLRELPVKRENIR